MDSAALPPSPAPPPEPAPSFFGWLPAFRLAGVDVRIHALTLPVQAALAFSFAESGEVLTRFGVLVTLLVVVLIHELSHGIAARAIGLRVFDVRVHAIGGLARIERRPPLEWKPREEWLVALAGPLGNLLVAGLALGAAALLGRTVSLDVRTWMADPIAAFVGANLALGLVNLVPAFPSDGGRVLRALLAYRLSYLRATSIALCVGAAVIAVAIALLLRATGPRALIYIVPMVVLLVLYGVNERLVALVHARAQKLYRFAHQTAAAPVPEDAEIRAAIAAVDRALSPERPPGPQGEPPPRTGP